MKNYIFLALCCLIFVGCKKEPLYSSGNVTSEIRKVANFTAIKIEGANVLDVDYGETFRVEIIGSDNLLKHYKTDVVSGVLYLGFNRDHINNSDVKIFVTLPRLSKIAASGSSEVMISGDFSPQNSFTAEATGTGNIIATRPFTVDNLIIKGEGAAKMYLNRIKSKTADINLEGSGEVNVTVSDHLKVKILGSSRVYCEGNPTVDSDIVGSGSVNKY